jgi:hypothetical protein
MEDWQEKKEVKKGNIGEKIVQDFLEQNNFILYKPVTNGAHKIDYFAHSGQNKSVICCEVKTKARMAWKCKTGFNISCYNHYNELKIKHNINTFIFFVDDFEKCVYGQWLHLLNNPEYIKDSIVWPLNQMKLIRKLNEYEINEILIYSQRKYDYSNVIPFYI